MEKVNDGGPAFPSSMTDDSLHVAGMSLRDYFAAKVVSSAPFNLHEIDKIADWAYKMADEMLKARGMNNVK